MKTAEQSAQKMSRTKKILLSILIAIVILIISLITYEAITVNKTYYIGEKNLKIPVFVYHDIVNDKSQIEYDYMQTTTETFEKPLTGLTRLGYKPITYQDLVEYKEGKKAIYKRSYIVTFDDGYTGIYENAYKIAKKYNIPMTSFVIDDCVGTPGYYTWEQAKEMHDSGLISIYSHGLTHCKYNEVSPEDLVKQTNKAYDNLRNNLQDPNLLKVFTYPYGLYTNEELDALGKEGYIQNLTDNKINRSKKLNLSGLHREYPLNNPVWKMILKIEYRSMRYPD